MAKFKGYKGYGGAGGPLEAVTKIDIASILKNVDLTEATQLVTDEYYRQGYNGEFGRSAYFSMDTSSTKNPVAILHMPSYSPYMLYGRGPGRMPPAAPIESWMDEMGISGSSWAIRKHIADFGTKGNNFITPIMPEITTIITNNITEALTNAIKGK